MRRRARRGLLTFAVIALLGASFAWLAAPLGFPFELTRHFTPQLAFGAAIIAAWAALVRAPAQSAAAGLAALAFAWAWMTAPHRTAEAGAGPATLTVAVFNARYDPDAVARFAEWAQAEGVDVMMLAEAHGLDASDLGSLFAAWPHGRLSDAEIGAAGFRWTTRSAVFSRWPVETREFARRATGQFSRPVIQLDVNHPDGTIQVTGLHPFPPLLPGPVVEQAAMFDAVAEQVPADGRFIVLGDLNTTVWSPNYARLPGLRAGDPRFASTFPAPLSTGGITIDHILVGDGLSVVHARVGPDLGSDHRPVIAGLTLSAD